MVRRPSLLQFVVFFFALSITLTGSGWDAIGPFGGGADIVQISRTDSSIVVIATRHSIYRSLDAGSHWTGVRTPANASCALHALSIDPRDSSLWYAGVDCPDAPTASGLYRTRDRGEAWSEIEALAGQEVWSIAFSQSSHRFAVGTANGVFESQDNVNTFRRVSPLGHPGLRPVVSVAYSQEDGTLFAGTTHLPWRTQDGGTTWESIHEGMLDDSDVFSFDFDPRHPTVVYASACSGVYRSMDSGARWSRLATPAGAFRAYLIAVDPRRPEVLYAGTSAGLMRSPDGGASWSAVTSDPVKSIAFDPRDPSRVFAASPVAGILVSHDSGQVFRPVNAGFSNRRFGAIASTQGVIFATSDRPSVFRTLDEGANWNSSSNWAGTPGPLWADPSRLLLFAARGAEVYRSTDGGTSWIGAGRVPGDRVLALAGIEAKQPVVFAATSKGIFRWASSATWTVVRVPPGSGSIQELRATGDTLAAVSQSAAMVSTDQGNTWKTCGPAPPASAWYGVQMRSGSDGYALAATSRGLLRSEDGCSTWTPVLNGLSTDTVTLVYLHPRIRSVAFAAQNGKIFLSVDSGRSWTPLEDEGRLGLYPLGLAIDSARPARLYALFPGRGVLVQNIAPDRLAAAGSLRAVAFRN